VSQFSDGDVVTDGSAGSRSAAVWLAQIAGVEAGDLEIDHGADILKLCDELGIPGGDEVDLVLTPDRTSVASHRTDSVTGSIARMLGWAAALRRTR
jgi:hypothetical protein